MSLIELTVENVRCIEGAQLTLHPRLNLIWGSNGSGKTSLLEALFLLGRGRSFRTRNSERLIRHGQSRLTVFGRSEGATSMSLGIEVSKAAGTVGRVQGSPIHSLAELSQVFPVQIIDPGVHKLVEEGAHRRRRWMDWAVFHVEPGFVGQWLRYTRTLKQRNAALRHQPAQVEAWDGELIRTGEAIAEARRRFVEALQPAWHEVVASLSELNLELSYSPGWPRDASLAQALAEGRERDIARGLTHSGPHRGDVVLRLDGRPAREVLSRGQQKLAAISMVLAQLRLVRSALGSRPALLLDDPAAELDEDHLQRFIAEVARLDGQLVLTALDAQAGPFGEPDRVFHVEQGRVGPV